MKILSFVWLKQRTIIIHLSTTCKSWLSYHKLLTFFKWMWKNVFMRIYMKNIITFIIVSLETGTNFPAVSLKTLLAIAMMNIMQRWNSTGVPTQSQLHAASLTLSPWNITIQIQWQCKAMAICAPAWGLTVWGTKKCQLLFRFYVKKFVGKSLYS